jgi:bifunctional enzyme CysN/CysC
LLTVWLTGLPAAGKTTIGDALAAELIAAGQRTFRLDGDVLRTGLCSDLGFSLADRHENIRRAGHVAAMIAQSGAVVVASLISPYEDGRALVRELHAERGLGFVEVFVDTPFEECRLRDPRGLYARAARAEISGLTGYDDPYEEPAGAEVHLHPATETVEQCTARVMQALGARLPSPI